MELEGSKTEKNLLAAFAGESQARNAYCFYAEAARKAGYSLIADVFDEIGANEVEHARHFFEFLGKAKETPQNLENAMQKEHEEHTIHYPEFARTAREEGFSKIAESFEQMARVEKRHEEMCRNLLKYLNGQIPMKERTVGHSSSTLAQVMYPQHANVAGNVHGGEIMRMMDSAAGVVAFRHAHTNIVTARVEDINFWNPVKVGDLVFAHAFLIFASRTSMEIRVVVETENRLTEERIKALTATFVFVALDPAGKPTEVPPLLLTTEEGEALYEEAKKRYEARKKK